MPQVCQPELRLQRRRVLGKPSVAHLHVPELALEHAERVFDMTSKF